MSNAKTMATLYLNGKRQLATTKSRTLTPSQRNFKSSACNLSSMESQRSSTSGGQSSRLRATSMTNLADESAASERLPRPGSRQALDSIHNGMNARYAQVQSKVYLQNIRPQSKIPASASKPALATKTTARARAAGAGASSRPLTSQQLAAKLKSLEDELAACGAEREALKSELEGERQAKAGQLEQLKSELELKVQEHEKQQEEYHKKLMEAYELAQQNRRAADSVLGESRQRDEESRKRIEELETQISELKEFVAMKEEMSSKMLELREQLRQERERYEDQLKNLHQVFESEKIRVMEEVQLTDDKRVNIKLPLDENSNYFNRIKPKLDSNESINSLNSEQKHTKLSSSSSLARSRQTGSGCIKCQSGSSQLHKSEQDMYGSKLSTRMQNGARSAWKASRKFASSVITGGVALSSCRQCTSRRPMAPKRSPMGAQHATGHLEQPLAEQHTSVIALSASSGPLPVPDKRPESVTPPQRRRPNEGAAERSSSIRVDDNNKLTIVTKFNEQLAVGQQSDGMGAVSSTGSERSRCESSSSGRGTSSLSDAGSSASQSGDDECKSQRQQPSPAATSPQPTEGQTESQIAGKTKGHRRRSSIFKATKVLNGSQVSLHKLKSFFGGHAAKSMALAAAGNNVTSSQNGKQSPAACLSIEHLESSRLRCMELVIGQQAKDNANSKEESAAGVVCSGEQQVGQGDKDKDGNNNNDEHEHEHEHELEMTSIVVVGGSSQEHPSAPNEDGSELAKATVANLTLVSN